MKKTATILTSLAISLSAFAQSAAEPNRLFVNDGQGSYKGFVIERVADLTFAKVEGEVKADVKIHAVEADALELSVTRSEACQGFQIGVLPRTVANALSTPSSLINYLENNAETATSYEDFNHGKMTGISLVAGGDYSLITVGIDQYGVKDGICREDFTAPSIPVKGNPQVTASLAEATTTSFSVKFVPNADTSVYYTVAGDKGSIERQYEQFGPMMGLTSMTQLVMSWGLENSGTQTKTWKDMAPNTDYEVYIVACDRDGNPAQPVIFETSTLSLGGHGEAAVDITLGDYKLTDWDGKQLPSQFITFTPNDQAACYRFGVYTAEQYDASTDEIKGDLCSEPPMPDMANWFFYETLTTDFQIDPGTDIVAIAAAKNIDGTWGNVNEYRFTTPSQMPAAKAADLPAAGSTVTPRLKASKIPFHAMKGKVPGIQIRKQTLTH